MHLPVLGNTFAALVAPILVSVLMRKLLNKRRASAHGNAEDPNPGAPSPSIPPIEADYDVFLSFRGVDTRRSFTDHLYYGLIDAGVRVFRDDDELRAGEKIDSDLLEAIENSKILMPIISLNYASSKWCLDGLVHVMECNKRLGKIVLPVFYKLESADVRHQIGRFGEVFHYYGRHVDQKVVEEWKRALVEVTSSPGWESEKVANGYEGELVKSVVQQVLNELKKAMELVFSDYLVGIDSHVDEVMDLVYKSSNAVLCVGIYGVGGIGKTTLIRAIHNKLSNLFEHCSFIADIRESCKHKGIEHSQNKLISDILKIDIQLYDKDEGINFISSMFGDKKVLIFLDDVNLNNQLEALAGNPNWFAPGSRIFVTTRNEIVLDRARVDIKYEHKEMDEERSLILFSRHAFRRDSPPTEFLALSRLVVSIIGGLPLVLEVIGSFLCGKQPSLWRDTIEKMQNVPHKAVQEKLRISYEELEEDQRQMFLDIACFLIGNDVRIATYMWDACGFCTRVGIEVLRSFSFINIGDNREFRMQNQIRDLGREIVHEENCEPHKCSRLWNNEEVLEVLEGKKGTKKIQAIYLEEANSTRIADEDDSNYIHDRGSRTFTDEHFRKLLSLRFLHMRDVNLIGDFKNTFSQLIWLKWGNWSPTFEAINLHPKELVILDLSGSLISDHWQGWNSMMMAEKLKVLNLTGCRCLENTSYLLAFKRLEILIFRDCGKLKEIDPCIGDMETLISLDLSGCCSLKELPPQVGKLEQLKELLLDQTMLQEIPSSIGSLKMLEMLSAKACKLLLGLPDSIGRLVNLRCLSLGRCLRLKEIPNSIRKLKLLTRLDLSGCRCLEELSPQMGELEQLKELLLDQTMIREIPSSFGSLKKLETLSAKDCKSLLKLPDSIGCLVNLSTLVLSGCVELLALPDSIGTLQNLEILNVRQTMIKELPNGTEGLRKLRDLDISRCTKLRGEVLERIYNLSFLQRLDFHDCKELLSMPELPSSLTYISVTCQVRCGSFLPNSFKLEILQILNCKFMESLDVSQLYHLRKLSVKFCNNILEIRGLEKLKYLESLTIAFCDLIERLDLPESNGPKILHARYCNKLVKIHGIDRLEFLEELNIIRCASIKKLDLPKSNGLKILYVIRCNQLVNIQGLDRLEFLERLCISECALVKSLDLRKSNCLKKLHVEYCNNLVEIDGIDRLEFLEELNYSGCTSIERLDLSKSNGLKILDVKHCNNLAGIQGLDRLEFLERLYMCGCASIERLDLSKSNGLKILDVRYCKKLAEIHGIDGLEFLESLYINACASIKRLDLPESDGLNKLVLKNCDNLVGIQGLDRLEFLERLYIYKCTSIKRLDLPKSDNLKILHARYCNKLVEIHGIDRLKFLKELNIYRCTSIKGLDLTKSNCLKILNVGSCNNLVNIQGLDGLKLLERLNISGCASIERLDLPKSDGLKILCADCDNLVKIKGLDKLKLLERLNISGCTSKL